MASRLSVWGGAIPGEEAGEMETEFTPGVGGREGGRLAERRGMGGGGGGGGALVGLAGTEGFGLVGTDGFGLVGTGGFDIVGTDGFGGLGGITGGERVVRPLGGGGGSLRWGERGVCTWDDSGGFRSSGESDGMGASESRRDE